MIDRLGITKVQITLDGIKEHHDVRRPLKNGGGTFDRIFANLKLFEEYSIDVNVRMNVDNINCVDYIQLHNMIKSLSNANIKLYPSPVEDINKDTINNISEFMTFEDFEEFTRQIYKVGDLSLTFPKVLDDRYCYCEAEIENSYVIDELGYCYKCWDIVGKTEMACFNITNVDERNYSNIAMFMAWDPFRDEKCGQCEFLPICFGGCKFHRNNSGKYDCGFTTESMKYYLEEQYFKD